ncbi:MAG: redoxin domain-containing protein, partial [Treponema sp.]|nr:redoxin domain-containing protein [Treponema sp.]
VFFATSCGRTKNFLKNINPVYKNFADVDVCFIEVRKAKQKAVTTFQKKYAVEEMDFAYDASGNAKKAMETYHKTFLPKVKTVNTPMIIYIDGNNIVQKIEHGKAFTAKEVREVIDNYLVPAK